MGAERCGAQESYEVGTALLPRDCLHVCIKLSVKLDKKPESNLLPPSQPPTSRSLRRESAE